MVPSLQNWAGNVEFGAHRIHFPENLEEVQELVAGSRKVRAIGTRHSFNPIADSEEDLISSRHLNRLVALDGKKGSVTVGSGISYGELCLMLQEHGLALHNLASLPHISVAGAVSTATHGSGNGLGCLSTAVSELKVVLADGSVRTFKRGESDFAGVVVGLGAVGFVTQLSLDISPNFQMKQEVFEDLPFAELESRFDEISGSGYSVSLFTSWSGPTVDQIWVKRRADATEDLNLLPATRATSNMHPIRGISSVNCTAQMGIPGPWYERLPHFRMDFTPSSGEELQSEYLIPRRHAWEALRAVDAMRDRIAPLLQISEVRTIAADQLWLSPSHNQDTIGIHFTWQKRWDEVRVLLPEIERALEDFDARPHWGKLFTTKPARLRELYPRMPDFLKLIARLDPVGKFRNEFLDQRVFGSELGKAVL